ncbi:MAG TPA: hypothetical protein PKA27_06490 [Fimbriimonadaceae bacterium]|nr:hypothetical protein [Fimbriimonadaceae bacterium]
MGTRLLVLMILLVVAGCGGSGTTAGGGGGGGGLDEGIKRAFMQSMGTEMNGWRALPRTQRLTNLVAWAKTQAGVDDAGYSQETDNVWVRYSDGDGTMYLDNKPGTTGRLAIPPRSPKAADQPNSIKAFCLYSLEPHIFPDSTEAVRLDLEANGYDAVRIQDPTIPQIIGLSGAGVVFWQTHSGIGSVRVNGVTKTHFFTCTGQRAVDDINQDPYKNYRLTGEVMIAAREVKLQEGVYEIVPVYAISESFIATRVQLADNSLVAQDSCTSAHGACGKHGRPLTPEPMWVGVPSRARRQANHSCSCLTGYLAGTLSLLFHHHRSDRSAWIRYRGGCRRRDITLTLRPDTRQRCDGSISLARRAKCSVRPSRALSMKVWMPYITRRSFLLRAPLDLIRGLPSARSSGATR